MFRAYDRTMRHKLGLLELEDDGDGALITDLLKVRLSHQDKTTFADVSNKNS